MVGERTVRTFEGIAFTPNEVVGSSSLSFPHPDDAQAVELAFAALRARPGTDMGIEGRFPHQDGSWRTLEIIATNLLDDPSVAGIVVNARDITERKTLEAELMRQAFHDPLTDLPNRVLFFDRVTQATARADRSGAAIAVMFLDLDNFKLINDSLGHAFGDSLLIEVAARLRACLRASDTVARLGGDEFMVLLEGVTVQS
jgi:PAS domain S-box-containing protein